MNVQPPNSEQVSLFEPGVLIADRYEVVSPLGKGGMGLVLRVIDRSLDNEPTALKLLYPHHVKDPVLFARFRNEVLVARGMAHPNIVRIYDFGSAGKGYYYISMELVQGYSLKDRIYSPHYTELDFPETCRILYEIGQGLAYAHRKGVIHRDIKPDNILMTAGGDVRISDFGLARTVSSDKGFTQTGETVGTPCYMAPEQIRGEKVDCRADIYSLGILAYEMATGSRPFEDESWFALAKMHMQTPMPRFAKEFDLPVWFEELVLQSSEKRPEDRFQSADEWLDELSTHIDPRNSKRQLSPTVFSSTFAATLMNSRKRKKVRGKLYRIGAALGVGIGLCSASVLAIRAIPAAQRSALRTVAGIERSTGAHLDGMKRLFGLDAIANAKTLNAAITRGDLEQVRLLLAAGVPLNSMAGEEPAVIAAVRQKQSPVVKELLASNVAVDARGKGGETLLTLAAQLDLPELFSPILERGVDVNERDSLGRTALMYAALNANASAVEDLIAKGAMVSLTDQTPEAIPVSIHAVKGGDLPTLQSILAKGQRAAANASDVRRMTALMYAASAEREDLMRALISSGADAEARSSDGKTFLDFLPTKLRRAFAAGSIPVTASTSQEPGSATTTTRSMGQTRLRMLDQPKVDWLIGAKTKIRSLQVVIRNVGDEVAKEVKISATVPGGQVLQLRGPTEMTSNAVATFQAVIDPSSPLDVAKVDKVDISFVCSNCWK